MLKEHNQEAYEAIKKMLKAYKECCIVAATGIGKSNIITELLKELGLNALIIVPSLSINNNWNDLYDKYNTEYFSVITYQYFKLHYKNLYGFDAYIFDEAHHMGAKEWGKAIKDFKSELIDELFIGATADDNRYFDEDIKTVANTFFNGEHVVYGLNQQEAIERGILPRAKYVCAIYNVEEVFAKYKTIELTDELKGKLNYTIQNCKSIENILQENIPSNNYTKGIVFVDNIKNIDTGVELVKKAFPNEPIYFIHSKLSKKNSERILNEFRKAKSGFIVSVNMLNEGNHIKGVNTIIMLRKTSSPSLYTQQIGRGLAANCTDITIFDLVRNDTSIKKILYRMNTTSRIYNIKDNENKNKSNYKNIKISNQFIIKDYATDILEVLKDIDNSSNNKWTEEEDKIIIDNYPTMGRDVYKLLPGRSKNSCCYRASLLGCSYNKSKWSEEEDKILKKFYPSMGTKVCELLPNKNYNSCRNRVKLLKLRYKKYNTNKWTEEEIQILRDNYSKIGGSIYKLLPGRSIASCHKKAKSLKIQYLPSIDWSDEEDKILKDNYS